MAEMTNLRSSKVKEQKRRVGEYGTETPLSSTAVERGSTRWLNGSTVVIEGLLDVTGTATVGGTLSVSGILNASGQINLSGSTGITGPLNITGTTTIGGNTNITGELNVTGPTTLDGELDIGGNTTVTGTFDVTGLTKLKGDTTVEGKFDVTGAMATKGTLSVEGITTLKNHLNVDQGKRITLGGLVLENQGTGSAAVQMPGGGLSASTTLGMLLQHDSVVIGGQSKLKLESPAISLVGAVTIDGKLTVTGATMDVKALYAEKLRLSDPGTTSQPANVYMDPNGWLYITT